MSRFSKLTIAVVIACTLAATAALAADTPPAPEPVDGTPALGPLDDRKPVSLGTPTAGGQDASGPDAVDAPPGYVAVSREWTAPNGTQTRGYVDCPRGTVVWGGGVAVYSDSLYVSVNGSFPYGLARWVADVNNASDSSTKFRVYAVCANKPEKYEIVVTAGVWSPPTSQSFGSATCSGKRKPLGGGAMSSSDSLSVDMNTTQPMLNGWQTRMNNRTGSGVTFDVYVICAKKPAGYEQVYGPERPNPAGEQSYTAVFCRGKVPTGGGISSSSNSTLTTIESTLPAPIAGWAGYENNRGFEDETIRAWVVCVAD